MRTNSPRITDKQAALINAVIAPADGYEWKNREGTPYYAWHAIDGRVVSAAGNMGDRVKVICGTSTFIYTGSLDSIDRVTRKFLREDFTKWGQELYKVVDRDSDYPDDFNSLSDLLSPLEVAAAMANADALQRCEAAIHTMGINLDLRFLER